MKLTKTKLKQIIKEELDNMPRNVLQEEKTGIRLVRDSKNWKVYNVATIKDLAALGRGTMWFRSAADVDDWEDWRGNQKIYYFENKPTGEKYASIGNEYIDSNANNVDGEVEALLKRLM